EDLEQVEVMIAEHKFKLWVMDTPEKRQEGMMFLLNSDFKDNEGMIFVFPRPEPQRFWMMNTLVDLDIAYVGRDMRILNVYTMKSRDIESDYSSWGPSKIVIEVRAGLFKKLNITRGTLVKVPPSLKADR
ncbi:MAG: DUF192 domain-containing protein, partial [Fimbriimonadaceae bacterium]|nr:DUF192 domain-containing protein [Fimbriimonadaceae bacterium]